MITTRLVLFDRIDVDTLWSIVLENERGQKRDKRSDRSMVASRRIHLLCCSAAVERYRRR